MNPTSPWIRLGRINYTNVWPVFHYFPDHLYHEVEIVPAVPTSLNKAMKEGTVHIGAISSFAYAENHEAYEILPDLSVSSYGKVNSILLFHRKPLEELRFGKIALPTTSATSVNLLKIIMQKFYEGSPEYFYAAPSLHDMMNGADAALLIGDDAIRASWMNREYLVSDLGEIWMKMTGRWMSFALWAVRKDAIDRAPGVIQSVYQAFQQSKRKGLSDPRSLIDKALREVGGERKYWEAYFSQLRYDFAEPQQAGLSLYYEYAKELGMLQSQVPLKLWTHNTVA